MSYLVYCVMNGRRSAARPSPIGVCGQTVWVLEGDGVCAAISADASHTDTAGAQGAAQIGDLLAYARVVEAFNRCETVVPMRYGCRFAGVAEVRAWLRASTAHLGALLRRLDECVEMGVRALLAQSAPPPAAQRRAAAAGLRPGAAYLAERRADLSAAANGERVAQTVREALCGRFRECVAETGYSGSSPMVSLYFLVERGRLRAFRDAFARIAAGDAALMLSGPWPPYNFVCGSGAAGDDLPLMRSGRCAQ